MESLVHLWRDFEQAAVGAGAPRFEPPDASTRTVFSAFEIPRELEDAFALGYPRAGVPIPDVDGTPSNYEGSVLFPPSRWLREMLEDPQWPTSWFPLSVTGDHFVQFVRSGAEGVWSLHLDDGEYEAHDRTYTSARAFLRAATATVRYVRPEALEEVVTGRWLKNRYVRVKPEIAVRVEAESCSKHEGPLLLPQTLIETS